MGWLGWMPEVALGTDVNLILIALEGRQDLLEMVFGSGEKSGAKGKPKKMSASTFKSIADRHNKRVGRAKK